MDLLKILTVILFIVVTIVTLKIHPDMHQPMVIENENFKLTRISDTLVTKNIPVSRPAEPEKKSDRNSHTSAGISDSDKIY